MSEDVKNLIKSIDAIAQTTAKILETMTTKEDLKAFATKKDLDSFKLETNTHFSNLETDLKSFKINTTENFSKLNEKFDDFIDTSSNFDKRIEVLEEKVGV